MEQEILKCQVDISYFARKYIWTFDEENVLAEVSAYDHNDLFRDTMRLLKAYLT